MNNKKEDKKPGHGYYGFDSTGLEKAAAVSISFPPSTLQHF